MPAAFSPEPTDAAPRFASCPVCGSDRIRAILTTPDFCVRECVRCLLAWTDPATYVRQSSYAADPEFAASYASRAESFRGYAFRLLKPLRRWQPGGKLLDVGCSVGFLVGEAGKLGFEAQGIDLDESAVRWGVAQGFPLACSRLEDWPVTDYDLLCASHTLEHFETPATLLQGAAAHLRPGGYLAIVVPCHTGLVPRLFGHRWYGWVPHQHYFHYSPRALEILFERHGFSVAGVWQESMDYRHILHRPGPLRSRLRSVAEFITAAVGGAIGHGDQVVIVGRKTGSG